LALAPNKLNYKNKKMENTMTKKEKIEAIWACVKINNTFTVKKMYICRNFKKWIQIYY